MIQQNPQEYAAELKKLQEDLETYRRDYTEYSYDRSVPLKEKAPFLASFAKLISSTLDRIKILEDRLSDYEMHKAEEKEKRIYKERQLEKKSMEPKAIPEKSPPTETKETNVPATTSKIVADKVILVIKVDPTKINYFGSSGEINRRIVFDRFLGTATMEFNKVFAGSGLKFPIQMQTCIKVIYYRERGNRWNRL
jgi:hypothetical protein